MTPTLNDDVEMINIDTNQMQRIARYEMTFKDIVETINLDAFNINCPDAYRFTLDDLQLALVNIKKDNPTIYDFGDKWFYPLNRLSAAFDLDKARGEGIDDVDEELDEYDHLPLSETLLFGSVFDEIEAAWANGEDDDLLSDLVDLDLLGSRIERFKNNKGKPILEWEFSDEEKRTYLSFLVKDDDYKYATENENRLAAKFANELYLKDDILALHLLAYGSYGGNEIFSCDFNKSKYCLERLLELTQQPNYANALGYIYYYGRCNGGVPQYDEAFKHFSYAALNGVDEANLKIADMYKSAKGCQKSEVTAINIYRRIYQQSLKDFLEDKPSAFADAALRMGTVYEKGITVEKNLETAFYYYLQADYAADLRAQYSDFFGDKEVARRAKIATNNLRYELADDYFKNYKEFKTPEVFELFCKGGKHSYLYYRFKSCDTVEITGAIQNNYRSDDDERVLVTIPELEFCEMCDQFTYTCVNPVFDSMHDKYNNYYNFVNFDYCEYDKVTNSYCFYSENAKVLSIKCDSYIVTNPRKKFVKGKKHRVASVSFEGSATYYDYLCSDDDIQEGDKVVVDSLGQQVEAKVEKISEKYNGQLPVPFKKMLIK